MKKTLLTLLLGALCASASAAGIVSMTVHTTDGASTCIAMESDMTATVFNKTLVLNCEKGTIEFAAEDVVKWTYSDEPGDDSLWGLAAIGDVAGDSNDAAMTTEGGILSVSNLPQNSKVSVVSVSGSVLRQATVSGEYVMSLGDFTPGIYIVTVNEKSFKIAINR